jgi:DNA-binding NtrC family response regulator
LPDQRPVPRTGKATVLLVEDESGVREFAATVLQQDGYRLLQAKSADSALEVWRRHSARVDLLLADVVLPGDFSGLQLSTKLQAEKPALKVILTTTGYGNAAIAQQSADGASHFVLLKPYTPRSLLRAVHDVLAR